MTDTKSLPAWRPLLTGARRDAAIAAVEAIAKDLRADSLASVGPSLGRGRAGLALAFTYLAEALPGRDYESFADENISQAIEGIAESPLGAGLYAGYTGVALVYDLVARVLYAGPPEEDALAEIDDSLIEVLAQPPVGLAHELIEGMAGIAVYAVGRGPQASAQRIVTLILDALEARAEHTATGIRWATIPAMLHPARRAGAPALAYNLGVSHGIPGTIAALAAIVGEGGPAADLDRARRLLDGSLRWLFAQVEPDGPGGLDYLVDPDGTRGAARLAWCYGDAGAAVALLWASRVHGDPAFIEAALSLGRRAAARDEESSGVTDAGLCHGASGLGHIFNRLWQMSGEAAFENAALAWFDRSLAYGGSGTGYGGYTAWTSADQAAQSSAGFLEGSAGIALAYASAVAELEPRWDRVLSLSPPSPA